VIVDYLHVFGTRIGPHEHDPPLIIDADRVLTRQIGGLRLRLNPPYELRSGRAISQKNKVATAPQIITNGIWTNAVFENFVVIPHIPFEEYSGSSPDGLSTCETHRPAARGVMGIAALHPSTLRQNNPTGKIPLNTSGKSVI
jgi:hypothetical protein